MRYLPLLFLTLLPGCTPTAQPGPPTASETSAARPGLQDRIAFLEQYVTFRRSYVELEYAVDYQNNGGGRVPGPSDWDIQIVAVVPPAEVDDWLPSAVTKMEQPPPEWVKNTASGIASDEITEWYTEGNSITVGVDRQTSTIAYRNVNY